MMKILFLFCIFAILYSYVFYPLLILFFSRLYKNVWPLRQILPKFTVIISAFNEENIIEAKVSNTLSLDYPEDLLEVLVTSDGSTDRTNEIVSEIQDSRLQLLIFPERSGKTSCLNRAVPKASGDIVLFTDANSMFPQNILIKLARNFASDDIGLVTGWTKYWTHEGGEDTTSIYSKLEKWTKQRESLISSCVGADGAIFAVRKSLYLPLSAEDINDFVIPLQVIKQDKRVVLDPEVYCFEEESSGTSKQYRRQVRITTRTLRAIWKYRELINPLQYGFFSFFLLSHKLMRFLVPFFFIGAFVTNVFLMSDSALFAVAFLGQMLFLIIGLLSIFGVYKGRPANVIKVFLLTALAQLVGWFRMVSGVSDITWTPQR